ncbi:aldo/keto reductase [Cryptosporangium minutisporangium]|uniref:Aldo/keto reductase n=1 Tax=Cryptosporangium minutisporangium TaxID=113569 RepID=A0ABP6T2A8_9ACTN
MKHRMLGRDGLEVSTLGLGCMGMSAFYGASDEAESVATLRRAIELGVTFWDTSDMYGFGANERLLATVLAEHRDAVQLATKFGITTDADGSRRVRNDPEWIRQAIDASLQRLGTDHVDLYYLHRRDPAVPIEEAVGAMASLVAEGKVRYLGLSEVNGETLRRAQAVHPIAAVQSEWSLWTRDLEDDVVPVARELGVGLVPYSPLGRGALTGAVTSLDQLAPDDFRRSNPRFADGNLDRNAVLVRAVADVAKEIGCTPAQAALAWLLAQGDDVVPIPGTRKVHRLGENAAAADLVLTPAQVEALSHAVPREAVAGQRYDARGMAGVNL